MGPLPEILLCHAGSKQIWHLKSVNPPDTKRASYNLLVGHFKLPKGSCNFGILMVCSSICWSLFYRVTGMTTLSSQLRQTAHIIKSNFQKNRVLYLQDSPLRGSIHGERFGERLTIRVPWSYDCVLTCTDCVPLAVRKTLRTVLHACLQLPENPALPRWFQAEMTFQVSLSDTKRAHRQVDKLTRCLSNHFPKSLAVAIAFWYSSRLQQTLLRTHQS